MNPEIESCMTTENVTVVVPLYNEEHTVAALCRALSEALGGGGFDYDVVLVDDGSTDGTPARIREAASSDPRVSFIALKRNFGQAAALAAGIKHARGDYVVTMDGDLQNDPADIPRLMAQSRKGFDVVCGWRKKRRDPLFAKTIPSIVANRIIRHLTAVPVHDTGCTLKVFRRPALEDLHLYGELHRFIPALVSWKGASVAEIEVTHHPRRHGSSKYAFSRLGRVILDLITVKFLLDYSTRPIQMFGKLGFYSFGLSVISLVTLVVMKLVGGIDMTGNPFIMITVLFAVTGGQFITIGLLGEISIRNYYELGGREIFSIAESKIPHDKGDNGRAGTRLP
jgi:glycosyltransferase involved in cell wall biosynthesis